MRKSLFLVLSVGMMTLTAIPALAWAPEASIVIQPRLVINPGGSTRVVRVVPREECGREDERNERVVIVKKRGHRWHRHHSNEKIIIIER